MMIKAIVVAAVFWLLPLPALFCVKMADKKISALYGYLTGVLYNLLIFHISNGLLRLSGGSLGMKHIAVMLLSNVILLLVGIILCVRNLKSNSKKLKRHGRENAIGKTPKTGQSGSKKQSAGRDWLATTILVIAVVICLLGGFSYLLYEPNNAVTLMAAVNRLDFFPVVPKESMVSLGYYLVKLLGLTPAYALCVTIPLIFYPSAILLLWLMTGLVEEKNLQTKALFFLIEVMLLLIGDGKYTYPGLVLHGLNQITNISLVICVPLAFILSFRVFIREQKDGIWLLVFDIVAACFLWRTCGFVCIAMVVLFALVFVGRRYLSWFQPSQS